MVLSKDTLIETDKFLSSLSKTKSFKPSSIDVDYFILASEFGLTLERIQELPVPYIIKLINTHNFIKKEEEKALKQSQRKK